MSEVSMCEYCGQLTHFKFCDEGKIALFASIKADRDGLREALESVTVCVPTPSDGIVPDGYIKPIHVTGHWLRRRTDAEALEHKP